MRTSRGNWGTGILSRDVVEKEFFVYRQESAVRVSFGSPDESADV